MFIQIQQSNIQHMVQKRKNQLTRVIKTLQQTSLITSQNNHYLQEIKSNITAKLRNTIIKKAKKTPVYYLLTTDNKNFLKDNYLSQILGNNIKSENLQKEIEKQKMNEFKEWIKNPQLFESYFNTKLTKKTLTQLLNPKYDLLRMLYLLENFLQQSGLKYKGLMDFKMAIIDSQSMEEFLTKLQELINVKKEKTIDQKMRILELLVFNIQNESEIKSINEYMQSYIKLYQSLNSAEPYTRFNTQQQTMKYFNFSVDQTTVVLRNPQLNKQKHYEKVNYQSEFAFINDGEYVFNNEYRPDFLCCDEIIDVERSINTMIGSEYMINEQTQYDDFQGKLVEINSYLRSDKKIFLRLRLNSVEFDKITIKILTNTTWQSIINNKKQPYTQFSLQIIPDEGDNRHTYGFALTQKVPQQEQKNDQSMISQQETHLVLQDDIIGLYLSEDEKYVICWNQTRNYLIHKVHIERPIVKVMDSFPFQSQLYLGIKLYTTVPQIEIYNNAK